MDKISLSVKKYLKKLGSIGGSRCTEAQTNARKRSVQIMNKKRNEAIKAKKEALKNAPSK